MHAHAHAHIHICTYVHKHMPVTQYTCTVTLIQKHACNLARRMKFQFDKHDVLFTEFFFFFWFCFVLFCCVIVDSCHVSPSGDALHSFRRCAQTKTLLSMHMQYCSPCDKQSVLHNHKAGVQVCRTQCGNSAEKYIYFS